MFQVDHPRVKDWVCKAFSNARARARKQGVPFNITKDHLRALWTGSCPALGCDLSPGGGRITDDSPSLDRIMPDLGYVPGNLAILSNAANRMKSRSTPDELELVSRWLRKVLSETWMRT